MKKIISYSLYNKRPKDVVNGIINCFLAKEIYSGWICRFYIDDTIPESIKKCLKTFDNVEIVEMPRHESSEAMLWRFLPASEDDVEVMISRDADSWLSYREFACVEEFLKSEKTFHIIRDHCYHSKKIMGGMWGAKKGAIPNMKELVDEYVKNNKFDQEFLAEQIYPKVIGNAMVHLGDQYDNSGRRTAGYFNDGGVSIPNYEDRIILNLSFIDVNRINGFRCSHCGKTHDTFIGGIINNIPKDVNNFLHEYFSNHNIETDILKDM